MSLAFQIPKKLPLDDPVACAALLEKIEFEEFKVKRRIEQEWEGNKLLYLPRDEGWHLAERTGHRGPNPKQQLILAAWPDRNYKVFTFTGGNRCLGYETEIFDPILNKTRPVGAITEDFHVLSFNGVNFEISRAMKPFIKEPEEDIYRIDLSSGEWFTASGGHLILTPSGWTSISQVLEGFSVFLPESIWGTGQSVHLSNVADFQNIEQGFQESSLPYSHYGDAPLRLEEDTFRSFVPLQACVYGHNIYENLWRLDVQGNRQEYSRFCQLSPPPSIQDGQALSVGQSSGILSHSSCKSERYAGLRNQFVSQPNFGFSLQPQSNYGFFQQASHASCTDRNHDLRGPLDESPFPIITSIKKIRKDVKYDFSVPVNNNYLAGGTIHHNSGKTAIEIWMAFATMFGEYPWDGTKLWFPHNKPRKVRLVGQDWEKHIKTVIEPALEEWWPRSRKVETKKNNVGVNALWTDVKTKSTLEIMSNGTESELHEGWMGDLLLYDEPPKREIRVANARGLVDRQGREFFCMTLLKEAWVDREVIKARNEDGTPDRSVFNVHAEIYDNVGYGLTIEGVNQFAKTLRPEEQDARLRGIPSYMHGIVLFNFRRERNLRKRFKVPLDWVVDVAIDFHPSKEWAVLFMATDGRGFKYLIDEIWSHGSWKTIGEDVVRKLKDYGCRVNMIIIDPLAKGDAQSDLAGESVFDKLATLFMAYGYVLTTASKDKENGIVMLNDLLFSQNEMPGLFVFDDLKRVPYEMEGWMYDEQGKPSKVEDDMVENLYRLVLLGTQYTPPGDEDDDWENQRRRAGGNNGRNRITGY